MNRRFLFCFSISVMLFSLIPSGLGATPVSASTGYASPLRSQVSDQQAIQLAHAILRLPGFDYAETLAGLLMIRPSLAGAEFENGRTVQQVVSSLHRETGVSSEPRLVCGTPYVMELARAYNQLDSHYQSLLMSFLSAPTGLQSSENEYAVTSRSSDHFDIIYTTDPSSPDHTTDSYAVQIRDYFEDAYDIYVTEWLYKPGNTYLGGARYRVYIANLDLFHIDGLTSADGTVITINNRMTGWENDDYKISYLLDVAAHEYYHAIQYSYLGTVEQLALNVKHKWVTEGSAAWAGHEVLRHNFPTEDASYALNDFMNSANKYLEDPSLDISNLRSANGYPSMLYWYFLADNTQINFSPGNPKRTVMRTLWDKLSSYDRSAAHVNDAIDDTLSPSGYGLDSSFKLFVKANFFQSEWYPGSPEPSFKSPFALVVSFTEVSKEYPSGTTFEPDIQHYAAWYFHVATTISAIRFQGDASNYFVIARMAWGDEEITLSHVAKETEGEISGFEQSGVDLIVGRLNDAGGIAGANGHFTVVFYKAQVQPVQIIELPQDPGTQLHSLVVDATGKWWLFYNTVTDLWSHGDIVVPQIFLKTSTNQGKTWSSPSLFKPSNDLLLSLGQHDRYHPHSAQPRALVDSLGRMWVFWTTWRASSAGDEYYATSDDNGKTWSAAVKLTDGSLNYNDPLAIEASLFGTPGIWVFYVDGNSRKVYVSRSDDRGASWHTDVLEQGGVDSYVAAVRSSNGWVWAMYGYSDGIYTRICKDPTATPRDWSDKAKIVSFPSSVSGQPQYPFMFEFAGRLHVLYVYPVLPFENADIYDASIEVASLTDSTWDQWDDGGGIVTGAGIDYYPWASTIGGSVYLVWTRSGSARIVFSKLLSTLNPTPKAPSNGGTVTSPVELKVQTTSGKNVIANAVVKFYVDGNLVCSTISTSSGYASCVYHAQSVGGHTWNVTAERPGYALSTSPTWSFTVSTIYDASVDAVTLIPDSANVGQGSKIIFTIGVTNTGTGGMTSARIQLKIYRPDGRLTFSPSKSVTGFVTGSTKTVQMIFALPRSAEPDLWTYRVYVYRSNMLLCEKTDGSFRVQAAVIDGEIVSVTDNGPVSHGGTATFTVKIENTGNLIWSSARITVKIYKPNGQLATQRMLTVMNVAPSVDYTRNLTWLVPATSVTGTYTYTVTLTYLTTTVATSPGHTITVN